MTLNCSREETSWIVATEVTRSGTSVRMMTDGQCIVCIEKKPGGVLELDLRSTVEDIPEEAWAEFVRAVGVK